MTLVSFLCLWLLDFDWPDREQPPNQVCMLHLPSSNLLLGPTVYFFGFLPIIFLWISIEDRYQPPNQVRTGTCTNLLLGPTVYFLFFSFSKLKVHSLITSSILSLSKGILQKPDQVCNVPTLKLKNLLLLTACFSTSSCISWLNQVLMLLYSP